MAGAAVTGGSGANGAAVVGAKSYYWTLELLNMDETTAAIISKREIASD